MTTLTIQIDDQEKDSLKKVLRKMNVEILNETNLIPNKITQKTIEQARKGKGLGKVITDIDEFMDSI
ncbi:hypothetical protein I5M32_13810 [Pedobacter sp. SD-b]|uniref:Uncharacterized protein n=1 Tax=Pedobacter segetis TaxID=2793069 RepID=A0ABS1BME0_9SPHI|nr:hypothetical protein [Pedobacter segetis]MBK0384040.1 hypothetical protein [Pedobacter segetis]